MAERTTSKATRIVEMERLYLERAYSDQELADYFGVDRSAIYRSRIEMETQLKYAFIEESRGRYRLDRARLLSSVRLSPPEALALYLGGRRLQQQTRTGQKHVASALMKLSKAMQRPLMEQLTEAAQMILEQDQDDRQVEVMERLVEGMINGRRVRIRHARLGGRPHNYTVAPYQLEPAVWGDGVYLVGHSDWHDGVAMFRLSRIVSASVTMEPFEIPDEFSSRELLQHAWGVWPDGEPTTVRLRFSAAAAPRVRESIWHPSQRITDLEDGRCEWTATIAGTREMVPWVRSWGAAVEVLEPDDLRRRITDDLFAAAVAYGLVAAPDGAAAEPPDAAAAF